MDEFFQGLNGKLERDAPIGARSWFRCGGTADYLYTPSDESDLASLLARLPVDVPVTIIGGMANTIIRDGGVRGVTLQLGKAFAPVDVDGDLMRVGAGALNGTVASMAAKAGLGGFEFFSGIPGTIGGAVSMNAGAYGREVKDCLVSVQGVTRAGEVISLAPEDLNMTYRRGNIPDGVVVTSALFKGWQDDKEAVKQRLKDIKQRRNATQPIRDNTGGSTFANPSESLRAWQVVDQVGGRDLKIGGASMSDMHANFMVNEGTATAQDLEALGDEIIARAQRDMDVALHWEVRRIGEK